MYRLDDDDDESFVGHETGFRMHSAPMGIRNEFVARLDFKGVCFHVFLFGCRLAGFWLGAGVPNCLRRFARTTIWSGCCSLPYLTTHHLVLMMNGEEVLPQYD